jgi:hypothetical protein
MTSFTTPETTEAGVRESREDALTIPATFLREEAALNIAADTIEGVVKSAGVVG